MAEASLEHRLTLLEAELRHEKENRQRERQECAVEIRELRDEHDRKIGWMQEDLGRVMKRLNYYDKMALKGSTVAMTLLTIGTLCAMTVDDVKAKAAAKASALWKLWMSL